MAHNRMSLKDMHLLKGEDRQVKAERSELATDYVEWELDCQDREWRSAFILWTRFRNSCNGAFQQLMLG